MSAIKDGRVSIMLDKERHMLFDLNAIDAVQDKIGDIEKLTDYLNDKKNKFRNIRWFMTLLLNEGRGENEKALTEEQVGRLINWSNFTEVNKAISLALSISQTGDKPDETDETGDTGENEESTMAESEGEA